MRQWVLALLFLAAVCVRPVLAYAEETPFVPGDPPELYARAAALIDGDSGRLLYGKNADEILPMASTTKLMTCILALEYGNLTDPVTVSEYAASMPDVQLNIRPGETYRLEDLLYSLMLESHNDSAAAVAEHIGGSVEGFARMMNQKARTSAAAIPILLRPTAGRRRCGYGPRPFHNRQRVGADPALLHVPVSEERGISDHYPGSLQDLF